jgi:hypothetical protein
VPRCGLRQGQRMSRARSGWVALAAIGLVLVVAGCTSGGASGPPTGTAGSTTAVTSTATASVASSGTDPTASPTGTAMPLPTDVPAAAREHSAAGAEAFVRFFFTQANRAWSEPRPGLLPPLCLSSSKGCASLESTAASMAANRQRYDGNPISLTLVTAMGSGGETDLSVDVQGKQEARRVLNSEGHVVRSDTAKRIHFQIDLLWIGDGWRVVETKVVVG